MKLSKTLLSMLVAAPLLLTHAAFASDADEFDPDAPIKGSSSITATEPPKTEKKDPSSPDTGEVKKPTGRKATVVNLDDGTTSGSSSTTDSKPAEDPSTSGSSSTTDSKPAEDPSTSKRRVATTRVATTIDPSLFSTEKNYTQSEVDADYVAKKLFDDQKTDLADTKADLDAAKQNILAKDKVIADKDKVIADKDTEISDIKKDLAKVKLDTDTIIKDLTTKLKLASDEAAKVESSKSRYENFAYSILTSLGYDDADELMDEVGDGTLDASKDFILHVLKRAVDVGSKKGTAKTTYSPSVPASTPPSSSGTHHKSLTGGSGGRGTQKSEDKGKSQNLYTSENPFG